MRKWIKAAFAVVFFSLILLGTAQSQDMNGVWRLGTDGDHSIHFMNNGKFTESNDGLTRTGTWSLSYDGTLYMYYDQPTFSSTMFDRVYTDGNTLYWYSNGSQISWMRGVGNTINNSLGAPSRGTNNESTIEDINKVDRDVIKRGRTNDPYYNETTDEDDPNIDDSNENMRNYPNRRDLDKPDDD